jgi:hypothetical protein
MPILNSSAVDKTIADTITENLPFIERKIALCTDLEQILGLFAKVSDNLIRTTDKTTESINLLKAAEDIAKKNDDMPDGFHMIYLNLMQQVFNDFNISRRENMMMGKVRL